MSMELETVDKLYLELSQFATARTRRELQLYETILAAKGQALALCAQLEECGSDITQTCPKLHNARTMAEELRRNLHKALGEWVNK